ncbi:MAG: hypothetical protein HFI92_13110 [Lachnospiraceae bacterium]|nr:hypothetical protein [Lachnospiraceae bacterium]
MKKRYGGLMLAACLLLCGGRTVQADEYTADGWKTQYADGKMTSNFDSSDVAGSVSSLLPGDSVTIRLDLENQDKKSTDWYMTNEVLSSLEDSQESASGGAYTYILTYTNSAGEVNTLYSSENVGGEKNSPSGEGLHEVFQEDYFYLDRLDSGKSGSVSLTVALDGETNGNGYQNTLAKLQMAFAVEPVNGGGGNGGSGGSGGSGGGSSDDGSGGGSGGESAPGGGASSVAFTLGSVQTGDASNLVLWSALALAAGLLLMLYGFICYRRERRGRNHA